MASKRSGIHNPEYLEAIRNNDPHKLDRLYGEFFPGIAGYVLRNSGSEPEAHDVFQEALIIIYRKSQDPEFGIHTSFKAYLFTVSKQLWMNELRKKGRQKVTLEDAPTLTDSEDITETLADREKDKLYRKKFAELKEDCQKLLRLFFDRTKMEEIARVMGYGSVSYAKKRKFQCKERLMGLIQADPIYLELTTN